MSPVGKIVCALAMMAATPASAFDASECASKMDSYKSSIDEIETYGKQYFSCIGSSRGHDDCSSEFNRLKSAQSDFDDAVSGLSSYECLQ